MAFWALGRPAAFLVVACVWHVAANTFLAQSQVSELTSELETSITQEIELVLGDTQALSFSGRVPRIEETMSATFKAMPKNSHGKLGHEAVRQALHRYFVQTHAWFVRGIADMGDDAADSPAAILQDEVDDFIQGSFERRLGSNGLSLNEMALLIATYENLIHSETALRMNATLKLMRLQSLTEMTLGQVDEVLEVYMMGYLMGLNYSQVSPDQLYLIQSSVHNVLPNWASIVDFLRGVRSGSSFQKSFFTQWDIESLVREVGDQYGRWQDKECQLLKQTLVSLEDTSVGTNGSGRVRITDFYGSAMRDGNWHFSESMDYLASLGALDMTELSIPRVVIPNYINSPSNCLASSKFYSVCCINECEELMDRVEHHFAAPSALPADILSFVVSLSSSSVEAGRNLHPNLKLRLDEIAAVHGGEVPFHGRLFAQWMHHAYPRECPFPHVAGTLRPQTPQDYHANGERAPTVTKGEMVKILETASPDDISAGPRDEITEWDLNEELFVNSSRERGQMKHKGLRDMTRPLIYFAAVAAMLVMLAQKALASGQGVKIACSLSTGKDVFV